jgi:hypothetical protein
MKLSFIFNIFNAFILCAAFSTSVSAQSAPKVAGAPDEDFDLERQVSAEPNVALTLCLSSGDVVVRGWDRSEVRARASGAGMLRLQTDAGASAKRVEVLVAEEKESEPQQGDCGMTGSIELNVPRGAAVKLQVHEGNIEISGVAEARVESLTGDVNVERVSRLVEVSCMSGDISLSDASGRVHLSAVSGNVEASKVRAVQVDDDLWIRSTSGDLTLEGITHAHVQGATISGNVLYSGPLARGGSYELKTTSGDVTLELPADASFRINARVVASGEIITDFPVKTAGGASTGATGTPGVPDIPGVPGVAVIVGPPPGVPDAPSAQAGSRPPRAPHAPKPPRQVEVREPGQTRLVGTVGAGDAQISISSFSGTLHLKKQ